jgi:hypothetical protein
MKLMQNSPKKLSLVFAGDGQFENVKITAVSREDEISRVEKMEQLSITD